MLGELFSLFQADYMWPVYEFIAATAPVWTPLFLFAFGLDLWMTYKRREFIAKQGSVLLEIKLPQEMPKSPMAMESFLTSLHNPGIAGNLVKLFLEGNLRPWYSLEIVSLEGTVHFYIWAFKGLRQHIETQLYAQFPGVEVHEVPDYTLSVHHDPSRTTFGFFGQLGKAKKDAYPIRTYVEYGLDKDQEEEYKIDPLVPLLEYMGSLGKGEQAWVQIMIQAHTEEKFTNAGRLFKKKDWKDAANEEIKEFIKKNAPTKEDDKKPATVRDLTEDQREAVYAMERNIGKWPFESMIRVTYFAEKEVFNPAKIGGLLSSFKQFSSVGLNDIRPKWHTGFKYPQWEDFRNMRKLRNERLMLQAYKRRSFFNEPFKNFHGSPFIFTTEELATLFHFPSAIVAATPTLDRVPSKKAQAPANLPI